MKGGWRKKKRKRERKRRVLAASTKLFTRLGGRADEQLLFHLFDILFKCFTCREMSRYREISGQTFPAFTKIPRIASNFLPRTRKICREWDETIETKIMETHGTFLFLQISINLKVFLKIQARYIINLICSLIISRSDHFRLKRSSDDPPRPVSG